MKLAFMDTPTPGKATQKAREWVGMDMLKEDYVDAPKKWYAGQN